MIRIDHNGGNPRQVFRVFESATFPFPTHAKCEHCGGNGGHHDGSRDHGHLTPWGGNDCDYCEGQGVMFSATAKATRRYRLPQRLRTAPVLWEAV